MKIQKKYTSYLGYLLATLFFLQSFSVFCQRSPLTDEGFCQRNSSFDGLSRVSKTIDGKIKFGFVDKHGNLVIDYLYDRTGGNFASNGYAEVWINDDRFLLYSNGNSYRFTDDYRNIDEDITALSIGTRNKKPLEIGDEVFEHTQIRALILYNVSANSLKKLKKFERVEHLKVHFRSSDIPVEIFDLVHLKSLIIINGTDTIPPEIGKLKNLERFSFITKKSLSVPPEIGGLKKLKLLHLDGSSDYRYRPLAPLPKEITQLEQLEQLTIKYVSDNLIPQGLDKLVSLKHLSLHIDTTLSPNLSELSNLESLNLIVREHDDNLNVQTLKKLTNLKSLQVFGSNPLLPESIKDLKQLKYLYLPSSHYSHQDNAIWIGELKQLEELELELPRKNGLNFGKLKKLKYLSIGGITDNRRLNGLEQLTQLEALKITPSSNRDSFLTNIPKEITHLTNLRYLYYQLKTESGFSDFPYEIAQLPKLEYLNRLLPYKSHHDLPTISNLSKELPEIEIIDGVKLQAESYEQLQLDLEKIKHVRKLFIRSSNVTELPPEIGDLVNIERLSIGMPVSTLPDEIKRLKNLKQLSVSHKSPRSFGQLEDVESFVIPSVLGHLEGLERLSLQKLNIEEIPHQVGKLKNLKYINLSNNKITEIPATIKGLENLEELHLGNNLIEKLPNQIGELNELKEFYIWENNLKQVPKSIGNLSNLEVLGLRDNDLSELPKEIGNLVNIKSLSIDNNNIKKLPETIGKLIKMREFQADNCGINSLPKGIKNWNKLEHLDLKNNNIENFPLALTELQYLKKLILSENNISEIPRQIGNMKYLGNLDLRSNNLSELPKELSNLHYLRSILLGDNKEIQNLFEVLSKLKNLDFVQIPKQNNISDINSRSREAKLGWSVKQF